MSRARSCSLAGALAALLALCSSARAEIRGVEVPLLLPDAFVERLLIEQVFTEPGPSARITAIADPCNQVVLSEPRVGHAPGRLIVTAHARAEAGFSWFGSCILPLTWEGEIDAEEAVRLAQGVPVLLFSVEDTTLRGGGGFFDVPALWDWIKPLVHPRLEVLHVDLGPLVNEVRRALPLFADHPEQEAVRRLVESLALADARIEERGLALRLRFEVEAAPASEAGAQPEPPLTRAELRAFEDALFEWDAFVTFVVKVGARETLSPERRADLLAALLDAREELVAALAEPRGKASDRVRALFKKTWAQLAPIFADLEGGESGWRYLAFVASGDALAALDEAGPGFGIEISGDGLRRLARTLAPGAAGDPLAWNEEVDPELRKSFGFDAELPPVPPPDEGEPVTEPGLEAVPGGSVSAPPTQTAPVTPPPEAPHEAAQPAPAPETAPGPAPAMPEPPTPAPEAAPPQEPSPAPAPAPAPPTSWLERIGEWLAALVGPAPASATPVADPKPAPATSPLDGRVPRRADLDRYLPQVATLLGEASTQVFAQGGLDRGRRDFFDHLVLATAWQESCWRQYVMRGGRVVTLRSSAGALGLMQVNPRVWRGFYAVDGLARSIRYNARAGSEILLHYLRDYAIARGEEAKGGAEALARATYAAYNGGPSHLRRYREPKRWPRSLAQVDASFLAKFRTVSARGALGVRECFSG